MAVTLSEDDKAYKEFSDQIAKADAERNNQMKSVFENSMYKDFFAKWFGCEVISLYVTSIHEASPSYVHKQIHFLYESIPDALDFPMFTIAERPSTLPYTRIAEVSIEDRNDRRNKQKNALASTEEKLSAELCANFLQRNDKLNFLLLPFGEIVIYCFLYHVIELIPEYKNDWTRIGTSAWNAVSQAYSSRFPGKDTDQTSTEILTIINLWYTKDKKKSCYLRSSSLHRIEAIYKDLPDDVNQHLIEALGDITKIDLFLASWANLIYTAEFRNILDEDLANRFFERSLINPKIEELLQSRGLYVTIIRSPLQRVQDMHSDYLSEAYVISTVYDSSFLEDEERRKSLDNLLRRISYQEIISYDYYRSEKLRRNQNLIQEFFKHVSSHDFGLEDLMQEACRICADINNARLVLVSLERIGTFFLAQSVLSSDRNLKTGGSSVVYFPVMKKGLTETTAKCNSNKLFNELDTSREKPNFTPSLTDFNKFIFENVGQEYNEDGYLFHSFIKDKDHAKNTGILLLYTPKRTDTSFEVTYQFLDQVTTALSIGFSMPFRSMQNKGLIASFFRELNRWRFANHKKNDQLQKIKSSMTSTTLLDRVLATMLEISQLSFILIGCMFLVSVFILLWNLSLKIRYHLKDDHTVTDILKTVESTVMAFSISLAALGLIFLMKPEIAFGQPKWMQRFSEPGTLEQTLVRLAAMVLTIDVLSVVLNLQESLQSSSTYLWILVKPAIFHLIAYLIVLIGLAFLSEFLLKEKDETDTKETKAEMK